MSGQVPPSSRVRARLERLTRAAVKLYRDFTGLEPDSIEEVRIKVPEVVLKIGSCDLVGYTCDRDDGGVKTQSYLHEFKKSSRPLLCVSADGKTLVIIGGDYEFTERGIEDR